MRRFATELRRRRVFRASGLYVLGAWITIQVAGELFAAFGIPANALRFVWTGLILLFPLAVVFAWFFELSATGIRRTVPAAAATDADLRLRPIDFAVLALLLVVGAGIAYRFSASISEAERTAPATGGATRNSIAVLPPENLSDDPEQAWFVSGVHDALIAGLSGIGSLRVTSKTSTLRYRSAERSPADIGAELGVGSLIEAAVYRVGDSVRISVGLIDVGEDRQVWTKTFERDMADLLPMQREIAREIARQVRATLTDDEEALLASTARADPAVYEAYLKGQFHVERYTPQDLSLASEYYRQALAIDPDYALAILGQGRVCGFRAQAGLISPAEARETCLPLIERALALDGRLAEAYLGYARHMTWQQFNWEAAGLAFRRAIELNPSYAEARMFYSHFLTLTGRTEEGGLQMQAARSLDPLNPFVEALHGARLMMIGDLQGCVDVVNRVHAAYPGFGFGHLVVWQSYYGLGDEAGAIAAAERHFRITRADPTGAEALESAYVNGDFAAAVRHAADVLIRHRETTHVPPINIAMLFEQAGDVDKAIEWYRVAFESYDPTAPYTGVLVQSPAVRSHPRFVELLRDMRLDFWADAYSATSD